MGNSQKQRLCPWSLPVFSVAEYDGAAPMRRVAFPYEANTVPVEEVVLRGPVGELFPRLNEQVYVPSGVVVVALLVRVDIPIKQAAAQRESHQSRSTPQSQGDAGSTATVYEMDKTPTEGHNLGVILLHGLGL